MEVFDDHSRDPTSPSAHLRNGLNAAPADAEAGAKRSVTERSGGGRLRRGHLGYDEEDMHADIPRWSRGSRIALLVVSAVLSLLLGAWIGITAAGGRPRDVLNPFTSVQAAQAKSHSATSARQSAASARQMTRTVTVTTPPPSQTASRVTVSEPPTTVTETVTETVTSPVSSPPPTTSTTGTTGP
jgi:hypothetical protein